MTAIEDFRIALIDAKLTSRDGTVVHASTREVLAALTAALSDQVVVARPLDEWHEDMGPMLWWCWEPPKAFEQISERVVSSAHNGQWLGEAPYCGTPLDDDWPSYHTHFTPIPLTGKMIAGLVRARLQLGGG